MLKLKKDSPKIFEFLKKKMKKIKEEPLVLTEEVIDEEALLIN